jgi:hypothetical protein
MITAEVVPAASHRFKKGMGLVIEGELERVAAAILTTTQKNFAWSFPGRRRLRFRRAIEFGSSTGMTSRWPTIGMARSFRWGGLSIGIWWFPC